MEVVAFLIYYVATQETDVAQHKHNELIAPQFIQMQCGKILFSGGHNWLLLRFHLQGSVSSQSGSELYP